MAIPSLKNIFLEDEFASFVYIRGVPGPIQQVGNGYLLDAKQKEAIEGLDNVSVESVGEKYLLKLSTERG